MSHYAIRPCGKCPTYLLCPFVFRAIDFCGSLFCVVLLLPQPNGIYCTYASKSYLNFLLCLCCQNYMFYPCTNTSAILVVATSASGDAPRERGKTMDELADEATEFLLSLSGIAAADSHTHCDTCHRTRGILPF